MTLIKNYLIFLTIIGGSFTNAFLLFYGNFHLSVETVSVEHNSNKVPLNFGCLRDAEHSAISNNIYDTYLKEELNKLVLDQSCTDKDKIKVIIMFEDNESKENRINIIDSIFNEYTVLWNYDIIPGVFMQLSPNELIDNSKIIEQENKILRVELSRQFKIPYEDVNLPCSSTKSKNDYPNWWAHAIGADNLIFDGSGVTIAVLDSGIYDHPDLNIVNNRNFVNVACGGASYNYEDENGHGTHVAGIIASNGGGSNGEYHGIAPGVNIINAKIGDALGVIDSGDAICAIDWADDQADIISMSFGGSYPEAGSAYETAISNAVDNGVICVVAAGNSGPDYLTGGIPAAELDAISVGATDENNNLASFSSWGPTYTYLGYPDVVAPGVEIISCLAQDSVISREVEFTGNYFDFSGDADYIPLSGTSMATPIVSGALAILLEAYPTLTPETARIALLEGATTLSDKSEDDILRSGAGLINISASLDFLANLNTINDTARFAPNLLPVEPFDLLAFPGDHQQYQIMVINGEDPLGTRSYNIDIPIIEGITTETDTDPVDFTEPGIKIIKIDISILNDATPGIRSFLINLTIGSTVYDQINVTFEVKLPEYNVLMESYHGLNDLFPEISFYQMGFYQVIRRLQDLNISVSYKAEYWTPGYDSLVDNSILTEERLSHYDLVILQNPVLPYSPLEINNLKKYFNSGGNLLFLGTRHTDLCVNNINSLFTELNLETQINKETLVESELIAMGGAFLSSQSVSTFNSAEIFNGVNKYYWKEGNTFSTTGSAQSISTLKGKTVATAYNGSSLGKGMFLAFGDLDWLYYSYDSSSYIQDHQNLLDNIVNFYFTDDYAINIKLSAESTPNPQINISIYAKNQTNDSKISSAILNSDMVVTAKGNGFTDKIIMNSNTDGISINNSYSLPLTSNIPCEIQVNFTNSELKNYNKSVKVLYYSNYGVPQISTLTTSATTVTRANGDFIYLNATLDDPGYDVSTFLSIYPNSFFNTITTVNKTYTMNQYSGNKYFVLFDPDLTDPSGYGYFYIIPKNTSSNYINPFSERRSFSISNSDPKVVKSNSNFIIGGLTRNIENAKGYVYEVNQSSSIDFEIDARDSVSYESPNSNLRVIATLTIGTVISDTVYSLSPSEYPSAQLTYDSRSGTYKGSLEIPKTIDFSTVEGIESISTITEYAKNMKYIGMLFIGVYDLDGGSAYPDVPNYEKYALIFIDIKEPSTSNLEPTDNSLIELLLILALIAIIVIGVVVIVVSVKRKRNVEYYKNNYNNNF
ncbi:MAG: S8 family peptidase [Promethearchaeota archaeon]